MAASSGSSSRKRHRAPEDSIDRLYLPSNDQNSWYYPTVTRPTADDEDEDELPVGSSVGNWGKKDVKGARWVRIGKIAPWGPGREEWENEERARKRIKRLLPAEGSPPPPSLPHLRSPTPPLLAPYAPPVTQHANFTSFVLDPSVQYSFRSGLIADLERTAGELIEGESGLRRALGRLWRVVADQAPPPPLASKRKEESGEEEEEEEEVSQPDTLPAMSRQPHPTRDALQKLFITPTAIPVPPAYEQTGPLINPQQQWENLDRSLQALRELQDDGRECVERLEEIREGLGSVRAMRKAVWTVARTHALEEMEADE